jgi:hypothetical protein
MTFLASSARILAPRENSRHKLEMDEKVFLK